MLTICRFMRTWRIGLALLALELMLGGQARAFYFEGTCSGARVDSTSITTSLPTGTLNVGDLLVLIASANNPTSDLSVSGGTGPWTIYGGYKTGTGLVSPDGGNNLLWSIANKAAVWTHVYAAGDIMPTIGGGASGTATNWMMCAVYGAASIDAAAAQATSSSATVTFPSVTPSAANDEAIFFSTIMAGANPTITAGATTTCSVTTAEDFVDSQVGGNPIVALYSQNQGPCSAAATSSTTHVYSASGNNLGVAILLKSAPFSAMQPGHTNNRFRDAAGAYDFMTFNQGRSYYEDTPRFMPILDGISVRDTWKHLEPSCGTYDTDYIDNQIINARILGKKVALLLQMGADTKCGGSGEIACPPAAGSGTDASNTPDWAYTSTPCDGSVTPTYINSIWATGFGYPKGSPALILDPNAVANHTEEDSLINFAGSRWSGISNIEVVGGTLLGNGGATVGLNNGANGGTVACNGTVAQCAALSQLSDWAASTGYSNGNLIFPTANNGSGSGDYYKVTSSGSCTSGSGRPTFSASCGSSGQTCTDGSDGGTGGNCSWTNEGSWTATISDVSQWLAITPNGGGSYAATNGSGSSTICSGSNQPWVVCDYEKGVQHYEQTWHSAFPNVVVMPVHGGTNNSPQGIYTNPDPFTADMMAYDSAHLSGFSSWQDTGLSCAPMGCPNPLGAAYLPYSNQPFLGVAFEENITEFNNTGVTCNTGVNGLWSVSAHSCAIPGIYYVLSTVQYPYVEFFSSDLQDPVTEPWLQLLHQFATGQ